MLKTRSVAAVLLFLTVILAFFNAPLYAEPAPMIDASGVSACLLIDAESGKPLYESDSGEKLPAAGLSRLAALLVISEAFDRGEADKSMVVTVTEKASHIGGTTAFLRPNERMDAEQLLLAAAMINAGDAIHSLACAVFGGEGESVNRINERMNELGLEGGFADICGTGRLFSAKELASVGAALIKSSTFLEYGTKYYEIIKHEAAGDTELTNPNRLIRSYSGCVGAGTGSSPEAGYCGVLAAKRGDTAFVAVVMGAKNSAARFDLASALLDHGFSAYRSIRIGQAGEVFGVVPVKGSVVREIEAVANADTKLLVRTTKSEYAIEAVLPEELTAPIEAGEEIGSLVIRDPGGEVLAEVPLTAASSAEKASFGDWLRFVLDRFSRRNNVVEQPEKSEN